MSLNTRVVELTLAFGKGVPAQMSLSPGAIGVMVAWLHDEARDLGNLDQETYDGLVSTVWTVAHNAAYAAIMAHSPHLTASHLEAAIGEFSSFSGTIACEP